MPPPPEAHTPYVASSPGMPPPPEAHTPYLVSVGLVGAETTAYPPSPATLQPAEAQETPEMQPQRPSPHSRFHAHTALLAPGQQQAEARSAHRADVQALQAHQQAREEQLQAWCAAQLQAQLRETEQGRETLLAAAAEAQAKGAADAAQRQAAAASGYTQQLVALRSEQREQ